MTSGTREAVEPDGARPTTHRLPYLPALDGLRALALAAVLLDHGGVAAVVGGHFGVTAFFVLSGFLVTALLVLERRHTGTIDLRAFWARRARRLVPASLLFFALALAYLAFGSASPPSTVVGDGLASLAWMANWRFVLTDRSYGDLFADPTPFAHLWSLAVEEQFYLLLPLVAALLLGRRGVGRTTRFAIVLVVVIAGSTAWMWTLYTPGADPLRVYYGTDTRIAELAVGSLLAILLVRRGELVRLAPRVQSLVATAGAGALVAIGYLVHRLSTEDPGTYQGGLLVAAGLSAVVVVACSQPDSWLARLLSSGPLPYLGRLTYGAYLFHWPVFLWCDAEATGLDGPALLATRILVTFTLAAVSHALVEQPIRLGRIPRPIGGVAWANGTVGLAAVLVLVAPLVPQSSSSLLASGATPLEPPPTIPSPHTAAAPAPASPGTDPAAPAPGAPAGTTSPAPGAVAGGGAGTTPAPAAPPGPGAAPPGPTSPPPTAPPATTAPGPAPDALRVAVVGDSLAKDLGDGLVAWSEGRTDVVVYNLSIPACPISRGGTRRFPDGSDFPVKPECGWWDDADHERRQAFSTFDPDVVLVEDALNEVVDRKLPEWPDYRGVGDPRFDTWLLGEYRAAAEVFSAQGATVVYADAPCANWDQVERWRSIEDPDDRVAALNRIYDNVVAPTTRVADLFDRLCPEGEFSPTVEGVEDARPDGFHLSEEARFRLAERWLAPFLFSVRS